MARSPPAPLLDSKFVPQLGVRTPLSRAHLKRPAELLRGQCSVVSVVAPAGYGKTTMLAQWHGQCAEGHRAWLNLDDNDNDPVRLLRYLIAALQMADPSLGRTALPHLSGPATTSPMIVLEALAGDLGNLAEPLLLFIDDAHVVSEPAAVQVLDWLLQYAPNQLRFVIGSRQAPQVALGGLRLRGRLVEYDQSHLAFTPEEVDRFCRDRMATPLDAVGLQRLVEKTEGWPAALELAMLALHGAPDPMAFIDDFCGSERGIVDYLGEAVFGHLRPELRLRIFQLAQFDRFCASLAQAVTGDAGADELLRELARRRLFLLGMDRTGTWFRFHHLVADYLRRNPPPGAASTRAEILTKGSRWFHAHAQVEDAIDCAVRAEDWELASSWLAQSVEDSAQRQGAYASLFRWMRQIPDAWLDRFPLIRVSHAFSLIFLYRTDQAEEELCAVERRIAQLAESPDHDLDEVHDLTCAVELQRLLLAAVKDEGTQLLPAVTAWLQRWPQARLRFQGDANNLAAFACKSMGDINAGLAFVRRAHDIQQRDQGFYGLSWNVMIEALLHLKAGHFMESRGASERGLALIHERLNDYPEHAAAQHTILAAIAYEFDEIDAATREIELEAGAIDATGVADMLILSYLTRARLQFCNGHADAGMTALRLGRQAGRRRNLGRVEVTLAGEECVWLSRLGERTAALALARQFGFDRAIFAQYDLTADKASRVGPRLLLTEAPEMAVAQLGPPLIRSTERGFHHRRVELLILQASALLRCARETEALSAFRGALEACERFGYRRVLLDDPDLTGTLLQAARGKLGVAIPAWLSAADARPAPAAGLGEAFTKKELRILKQLESGLANRDVAASLFISEGTLKWHLHNIYRKLGCKSRARALVEARRLGVLQR